MYLVQLNALNLCLRIYLMCAPFAVGCMLCVDEWDYCKFFLHAIQSLHKLWAIGFSQYSEKGELTKQN